MMSAKSVMILVLLVAAPALAGEGGISAPAATVDALVEQGFAAYHARDYRRAAETFLRAHTIQPDPNLLFNIGRCYEALGDRAAAIEKYQAFLASPDADPAGRRRAEEALATLRRTPASAAPRLTAAPAEAPAAPHARSALPYAALGVGLVAVAVGGIVYALGVRDHQRVTSAPGYGVSGEVVGVTEVQAQRLVDSGRTRKLVGGITMGVGAAIVTGAVAALFTGPSDERQPPRRVAVGIAPGSGGGSLTVEGRF
jgi:hypothetical protein